MESGGATMSGKNNARRNPYVEDDNATMLMGMVLSFLCLFLPKTLAKKVVCTILLVAGAPVTRAALLSGLTERCVRDIGRSVRSGKVDDVLTSRKGSGRRSKTAAVEEEIIAEMSKKDYHTLQEIADMIKEKFRIVLSLPSVSKLLKKTTSAD